MIAAYRIRLFFFGMLLFVRFLPMLPMFELRLLRYQEASEAEVLK